MSKDIAASALAAYEKLVDRLQKQIDKLEAENADLKRDNEFLKNEVVRLNSMRRIEIPSNPFGKRYPYPEGPFVFPPKDNPSPNTLPDSVNPGSLPDSVNPGSLPDSITVKPSKTWTPQWPRPWYENPDRRLNCPDGPDAGAGKIVCQAGGAYV